MRNEKPLSPCQHVLLPASSRRNAAATTVDGEPTCVLSGRASSTSRDVSAAALGCRRSRGNETGKATHDDGYTVKTIAFAGMQAPFRKLFT
ncbi:unnamed protein product [Lasius platythorax]|uniref:Uncharacterized protein n=1 Tax=Lasius platythorax TaxID=488582 RepID=A0AAV2NF96_9HYME